MNTKHIIAAFITGVILTVFAFQAYTIYQYRMVVAQDHAALTQVVDFLNKNTQQSSPDPVTPKK